MPSWVLVPLPISSMITSERSVQERRISADSLISTRNVDSPRERLSEAPTLQNILSTIGIVTFFAGTKDPIWARSTIKATCLRKVDLPAMLGPVMRENLLGVEEKELGT